MNEHSLEVISERLPVTSGIKARTTIADMRKDGFVPISISCCSWLDQLTIVILFEKRKEA